MMEGRGYIIGADAVVWMYSGLITGYIILVCEIQYLTTRAGAEMVSLALTAQKMR